MDIPKAFVSYSWDDEDHKAWIRNLATLLRKDGVETILDQWHAAPGDQLPAFMERAVRENDFVLIVCTPKYKLKSDGRSGGVGYEGDVIQAEVLTKQNPRKFIPILRKGEWTDSAPSSLLGKYYIDLRDGPHNDANYQHLVLALHDRLPQPPPIGKSNLDSTQTDISGSTYGANPSYTDEDTSEAPRPPDKLPHFSYKDESGGLYDLQENMIGVYVVVTNDETRFQTTARNVRATIRLQHLFDNQEISVDGVWVVSNGPSRSYAEQVSIGMNESRALLIVFWPNDDHRFYAAGGPAPPDPLPSRHLEYGQWSVRAVLKGDNIQDRYDASLTLVAGLGPTLIVVPPKKPEVRTGTTRHKGISTGTVVPPMPRKSDHRLSEHVPREKAAAILFGIVFLVTLIGLGIFFPDPTPFQYLTFRVTLALASAGVAAFLPGFIEMHISPGIRAGGALAVFAIVYFLNPAAMVSKPQGRANIIPKGRIRLLNDDVIPAVQNPAGFPAITFYYDNAGTDVITGTVSRFGAGIGDGLIADKAVLAEQDKLLRWDGWAEAMARKKQSELRPNDPGEYTTIPNTDDVLAKQFRKDFDNVQKGKKVFYAFITFKFFDSNGRVGVTETCSYFSLTFARHKCGRERTFYE